MGAYTNKSSKVVLQEYLPYFCTLYTQDREFRLDMTKRLNLTEEEVGFLLGQKPDSQKVRRVFDDLRKVEAVGKTAESEDVPTSEDEAQPDGDGMEPDGPDEDLDAEPEVQSSLLQFE
jgi:hypothetical protein